MKWVYNFNKNQIEGNASMKNILGSKGANLAELFHLELPVPPGFTIITQACADYYSNNKILSDELIIQVKQSVDKLEQQLNLKLGSPNHPLLLSIRSGALSSMPGMMDTILNLGLNDQIVEVMAMKINPQFAYDSYRRFIQMYASVVMNMEVEDFELLLHNKKQKLKITCDTKLTIEDLKELIIEYKIKIKEVTKQDFPQDVLKQLICSIRAVLDSWMSRRAIIYRKLNNIKDELGTAVNVQAMVFGNLNDNSATGVVFTRNPSTGERNIYGEYLINAQGEDVVAGIRTPQSIIDQNDSRTLSLQQFMPKVFDQLVNIIKKLELHYRDMQDIEFTIQDGKLWILQTRNGKRTAKAALKIAVDMVREQLISKQEAICRIKPESLEQLLHPNIDNSINYKTIAKGLPASPGAASGIIVFSSEEALAKSNNKIKVILVRAETSPEDIHGMHVAEGILTSRGGMTSHAAVVARGMGKPCVCGVSDLIINKDQMIIQLGELIIKQGEIITINGSTGDIIWGEVPTVNLELTAEFKELMKWSDKYRQLKIRANAETIKDANNALLFGAQGIGLCRTEHMFFAQDRINIVRQMIIASTKQERELALEKLLPMQQQDFIKLFEIMNNLPINIRLLDPPLHEFLPTDDQEINQLAKFCNIEPSVIKLRISQLKEENPMLGHRGCRLGISFPEIYQMQIKAIFEAMIATNQLTNNIEIMIPLVISRQELIIIKQLINQIEEEIYNATSIKLNYQIGTMIELPRAALLADEIAKEADFFSFGTNDLTQTTFGMSRDDSSSFLNNYLDQNIIKDDPFVKLDIDGVGKLIKIAVNKARKIKGNAIKLGICGEQAACFESILFFQNLKFDYISCSPYRIPVARLAAAQAAIIANE